MAVRTKWRRVNKERDGIPMKHAFLCIDEKNNNVYYNLDDGCIYRSPRGVGSKKTAWEALPAYGGMAGVVLYALFRKSTIAADVSAGVLIGTIIVLAVLAAAISVSLVSKRAASVFIEANRESVTPEALALMYASGAAHRKNLKDVLSILGFLVIVSFFAIGFGMRHPGVILPAFVLLWAELFLAVATKTIYSKRLRDHVSRWL